MMIVLNGLFMMRQALYGCVDCGIECGSGGGSQIKRTAWEEIELVTIGTLYLYLYVHIKPYANKLNSLEVALCFHFRSIDRIFAYAVAMSINKHDVQMNLNENNCDLPNFKHV